MQNEKDITEPHCAIVRFGTYAVDRRTGELRKHGINIKLSGQPLDILLVLLERPGELVTREELRSRLWQAEVYVDFEHGLNSAVRKLRRALRDNPQQPRYIETHPRKGYRFIGSIDETHVPLPPPSEPAGAKPPTPLRTLAPNVSIPSLGGQTLLREPAILWYRRKWLVVGAVAAAAVIGLFGIRATSVLRRATSLPVSGKPARVRPSIAVLGFKNLGSRTDIDWLSTAFTQMLATELSVGERLRTIPEENVVRAMLDLHLRTTDGYARDTLRALHTDLGSDYVVAGSYVALPEKSGGQIRLDLRLQDTRSGETLASIAVSGNQSEVFDLVARAGTEIRAKLGAQAEPREVAASRTALPSNPDAVRLYSEGLRRMRVFDNMSARDVLEKAVAAQPDFALAHSALAQVWSALGYDSRALASAQKAMELSKTLPEDQRLEIEGRYFEMKRDWAGAIGVYRHLWQDHPDDLEFGLRLARVEGSKGDTQAGLKTLAALRKLPSPQKDDPRIDLAEGSLAALKSDYKRQRELAQQAAAKAQSSGARLLLARARLVEGWALDDQSQFPEAIAAFSAAEGLFRDAGDRNGMATAFNDLGIVLQKQGDLAGAREKLAEARAGFEHIGDENGLGAVLTNLGEVYRAQGELNQAEELYQQALRIFRRTGRKDNEYATMNNLGAVLFQRGDFRAAGKFFEELLQVRQAAGDKNGVALAKTNLGDVLRVQGKLDSAAQLLNEALATFRELGDQATAAGVQLAMAKTLLAQRSFSAARQSMEDALAINQKIGAKGDEAYVRVWLARVALEEGRPGPVEATLDAAISELDKEHRTADQAEALAVKARALLRQGLAQQAWESVQRARAMRAVDWLARFQLSVVSARVQAALGKNAAAKRELAAAKLDAQRAGCAICELEVQ